MVLVWCICCSCPSLLAQRAKRNQLEIERKSLYKDIQTNRKLLQTTQSNKTTSLNELNLLQNQINSREKMINLIEQEINLLDMSITQATQHIDSLNQTLDILKHEYAEMVRQAYLTENTHTRLLFLFSAKDMNDGYKRMKYMEYYRDHRKKQLNSIKATQDSLVSKITQFKNEKNEQSELLGNSVTERNVLEQEKSVKNKILIRLKSTEQELKSKVEEQKQALTQLNDEINALIAAENKAVTTNNTTERPTYKRTPEMAKLSEKFEKNKGKLPWPVEEGVVTARFGTNPHPVLANISVINNGINIATAEGNPVRAIFGGKVSNVLFNPTFQWAVIVKHGDFYTVYAQLASVDVVKGEEISIKQNIGTAYTNAEEEKTEMHFEIWELNNKLNPAVWLSKR